MDTCTTIGIEPRDLAGDHEASSVGLLVCLSGTDQGWSFVVPERRNLVGANGDCDVVVTDSFISGGHATIGWDREVGAGRTAWRFSCANPQPTP